MHNPLRNSKTFFQILRRYHLIVFSVISDISLFNCRVSNIVIYDVFHFIGWVNYLIPNIEIPMKRVV